MIQLKKLYACQKAIIIKKEWARRDSQDVNFSINKRDMLEAMNTLSTVGFKIYMYCMSNQNDYIFGLSRNDVCKQTGVSSRSYTTAIQELIQLNYLVYDNEMATDGHEQAPVYTFYSRPIAKIA